MIGPHKGQTSGEEVANAVIHAVGSHLGAAMVALLIWQAAVSGTELGWKIVSASIFGACTILLYSISSAYHAVSYPPAKHVLHVMDHMAIYFLIAGSYTPFCLVTLRPEHPVMAWVIFGIEGGCCAFAATLKAIDLDRFDKQTFVLYITMGWAVIVCAKTVIEVISWRGFFWILMGGISFSLGAILYALGPKVRYFHSVFHIFVIVGCLLQFFGILFYVL